MRYKFKHKPYEHQLTALNKSWNKPYYALFMDMGTGKSKVLIDTFSILYDQGKIRAVLIVAPKSVYQNWLEKEIPLHIPDHVVHKMVAWSPSTTKKNQRQLEQLFEPVEELKILLMNVEAFSTKKGVAFAAKFLDIWQGLFAIDESTTIKNKGANRTKNLIKLSSKASYRRILTGSPITRSPLDLFTQCEFLKEGALKHSSYWTFQSRYAQMIRRNLGSHAFNQIVGYQNLDELNSIIEPFSYRIRKEDCLDLPDKVYIRRTVELTKPQMEAYNSMKRSALALVEGSVVSASTVLTQILRLQQVCSGFVNTEEGEMKRLPNNKLSELVSAIEEISGKVIIWANFTADLHAIKEELIRHYGESSCALFSGETPSENRQQIVTDFQDAEHPLRFFIGQPRTGGFGLTLTQARAHRIGQNNKVTYIDIVTEKTVDEKILRALRNKINIASLILAEGHRKWLI